MPSDILQIDLAALDPELFPLQAELVSTSEVSLEDLATAYFESYPPGIASGTLGEAQLEIQETYAHAYGTLIPDACFAVVMDSKAVGAIFVVESSIWDADLSGPFIIDLFLKPEFRNQGLGKALVMASIKSCVVRGDQTLSLRIGEGSSKQALGIYKTLGFTAIH